MMGPGYDQFFKKAKKASQGQATHPSGSSQRRGHVAAKPSASAKPTPRRTMDDKTEELLREALQVKAGRTPRKASRVPVLSVLLILLGLGFGGYGLLKPTEAARWFNQIEVKLLNVAEAADPASDQSAKTAETKAKSEEQVAEAGATSGAKSCIEMKGFSEEEMSHFNKLNDRKNELDMRETELNALEEELHKQKVEIESRVAKLEQIREEVAGVLKERVEVDQQRVNTLVDFYSNMKPKQAADIFGKLNEDLAVEVLGKMKKKNAADILNLLEPMKARTLSEKFTGYKRL